MWQQHPTPRGASFMRKYCTVAIQDTTCFGSFRLPMALALAHPMGDVHVLAQFLYFVDMLFALGGLECHNQLVSL